MKLLNYDLSMKFKKKFLGKIISFVVMILFVSHSFAAESQDDSSNVQVYLPGLQFRFEDTANQSRETRSYTIYSMQAQYLYYAFGLEYNSFQDETGNSSLGVNTKNKEYNLTLGYQFYEYKFTAGSPRTTLNLFVKGYAGTMYTEVTTNLLNVSQTDRSEDQLSVGAGVEAQIRVGYAVLSVDSRYMQSENYSPSSILVSTLRLGAIIYFY